MRNDDDPEWTAAAAQLVSEAAELLRRAKTRAPGLVLPALTALIEGCNGVLFVIEEPTHAEVARDGQGDRQSPARTAGDVRQRQRRGRDV